MKRRRSHIEMQMVSTTEGWHRLPGFPSDIQVRMLADDLDEGAQRGARTRLVRFAPGARTVDKLVHPYWEEVFVLSGDLVGLDGASAGEDAGTGAHRYSCRPPGTAHGPFVSHGGCVLFEVQYFQPA